MKKVEEMEKEEQETMRAMMFFLPPPLSLHFTSGSSDFI